MSSPNQEYREDLAAHGECRDCEVPLLATEKNYSRCAVCRAKRAARKGIKRGYGRETMARLHEKVRLLKIERIRRRTE